MKRRVGLEPFVDKSTRVLVLGSFPGNVSLECNAYYAHRSNHFWRIMEEILKAAPGDTYSQKLQMLRNAGIGLWDVITDCSRVGSLDSDIRAPTVARNRVLQFVQCLPRLRLVCLNGAKATRVFMADTGWDVLRGRGVNVISLPSTSAANAKMPFHEKLAKWRELSGYL